LETQTLRHALRKEPCCIFLEHLQTVAQYEGMQAGSDGIATRYGLDGPGIESRRRRDFLHTSRPVLGHTQPAIQCVSDLSRG
jgi:hypothetical protein